ncbi:MAG: helix-turn-helix domain-containing protein [Pseudomonadota bacterium]
MKLSLTETSDVLGKSERQIRYMIRAEQLPATKVGGRWEIDSADLPLTDAQRAKLAERAHTVTSAMTDALESVAKATTGGKARPFSVTDFQAFQIGRSVYHDVVDALGPDSLSAQHLYAALAGLTRGCHAYRPADKAAHFSRAREATADSVTALLVNDHAQATSLATRIEQEVIPKLSALLAAQERRGRRSRFDNFGGMRPR